MLVGSFSSNLWGIPRSTKGTDFVVELGQTSIGANPILAYIPSWCDQHGTRELFEQLLAEAQAH